MANRLVSEDLELSTVLRHVVEAATEMVGAAYGAIGTLGPDGRWDEFIQVGRVEDVAVAVGRGPVDGPVGGTVDDPRPVWMSAPPPDRSWVSPPSDLSPTSSFLGVPVRVRDVLFGYLYLADPRTAAFTPADQGLLEALAATAGVSIAHARLFQASLRREQWSAASAQITQELLSDDDADDALELVAQRVLELALADLVAVVLPAEGATGDGLVVHRAVGARSQDVASSRFAAGGTLVGRAMRSAEPQLADRLGRAPMLPPSALGPAMAVPLVGAGGVRGSLVVVRDVGSRVFTRLDLDVVASFAGQAALALERADARLVRLRAQELEERERIAGDLHDHVVQRLFAAGLHIQSVCTALGPGPETDRLNTQIDEIDATIRQIRTTIFGLHRPPGARQGVGALILDVVAATTVLLPGPPEVTLRGPLDLLVPDDVRGDLLAVVREALTNAGRHAAADRVEVVVTAAPRHLTVEVLDDGRGAADVRPSGGLRTLRRRASARGGSFEVGARDGGGTRLLWSVPLPDPETAALG